MKHLGSIACSHMFIDLDGTLVDYSQRHYRAFVAAMGESEVPLPFHAYWTAKRRNIPVLQLAEEAGAQKPEEVAETFFRLIEDPSFLAYDRLPERIFTALARLHMLIPFSLLTNRRNVEGLEEELKRFGIDVFFDEILAGGEQRQEKFGLIQESRFFDETGVVVGDTEEDILTGRRVGFPTVAVANGIREESLLRALGPTLVIPSFDYLLVEISG